MTARRFVLVTHRWLGLGASVVLAVAGATGAVMVWEGEHLLRRVAGRFHTDLALGRVGAWIVLAAAVAAVLLQIGGVILWWKRKLVTVRLRAGWPSALFDLHHAVGILGVALMITMAVTALCLPFLSQGQSELRQLVMTWHTGREFPMPVKVIYSLAATGFLIQGVSGVLMWWRKLGTTTG